MDNLTHTLFSLTLARAGGKNFGPYAAGLLVVAGNAPDIDVVSRLGSTATFLHWHRGSTHSLVVAPVLALAVVALFVLGGKGMAWRRKAAATTPFGLRRAYLVALGGVLWHVFMDWSTGYGTRVLAPFSSRWLALDAVPIIDFWLLAVLLAALALPYLFHLISEEIGAGRGSGRGAAIFAVAFLLAWFGFRVVCHARAAAILDSHLYAGLEPRRVGAFADGANPFRWHGVVETSETWQLAEVNLLGDFDPMHTRTCYPPEPSPALDVARKTRVGEIFLDFARFPYSYVEQTDAGFDVVMRDLRFDEGPGRIGFAARIKLSPTLAVVDQVFSFHPPQPVR